MSKRGLNAGAPFAEGRRGVVAAKHILAARAGIEMLERGGNAVDAAVATGFSIGVVEPWMSGLGGIGYMVIHPPSGAPPQIVDYGAIAPATAHADTYQVVPGRSTGLFPWPLVRDDANHQGWRAVAVPGTARGLGLALERFGTLDLATILQPAIRLAADGFPVSWYATLRIALDAAILARYSETARTFLPQGVPVAPPSSDELSRSLIVQPDLAETLQRLARYGVDEFYTGETARRIVSAMQANAGLISSDDLESYRARIAPALTLDYGGWRIGTPGGPTGGTTLARILTTFQDTRPRDATYGSVGYLDALLRSLQSAFAARYTDLGDEAPLGVRGEPAGTSTTHFAVADEEGMVVSCTQTLLAVFGSRVTVPGTGVLLNDGMYWFDPRPGQANSVGPRKRPLSNMTPLVAVGPDGWPRIGLGSSGGRRIVSANVQMLLAVIDGGLDLQDALAAPRVDASGEQMLADIRMSDEVLGALEQRGWDVLAVEESPFPRHFASPAGVAAYADGRRLGAADTLMPAGVAAY